MKNRQISKEAIALIIIAAVLGIGCISLAVCYALRPYDNCIQLPYLKEAMEGSASVYQFDTWEVSAENPQGEPILTLEPQELLILEFYEGGKVLVSNGYTKIGTQGSICYTIPQDVLDAICEYHSIQAEN